MPSTAAAAAGGLLFPGAGARTIRTAPCHSRPSLPVPARVRVRLPRTTASSVPAARVVRRQPAPAMVRRAPSGNSNGTGLDALVESLTEAELASLAEALPSCAPSIEELVELDKTDFSPEAIEERFVREPKEAAAAVKGAVAGLLLRPLRDLVDDVRKLRSVYDIEEFQIGLPAGALLAIVAAYQLWKAAPSACVDFLLNFAFYRLCVMAAEIRRRGFATDMIIRLKFFILIALLIKNLSKAFVFADYVRYALFAIYFFSVGLEVKGLKKYGKYILQGILDSFKTPEGRRGWLDTLSNIDFGIDEDD